jgi:type I restriction enzyme S subunit
MRAVAIRPTSQRQTVALGTVCKLVNGNAYNESMWSSEGVPIIRIQNLNNANKPFNYWDGPIDGRVVVNNGDVLLAWSGTPGTSFGAHRWHRGAGVLNQHIFRVDFDHDEIDPDWMVFAINEQLEHLIGKAHGAVGLSHVTRGECDNMEIWLPDLATQCRLASRLKGQKAAVEQARRAADDAFNTLRSLLDKTIADSFHGITPLSLGRDEAPAPKDWRWQSLLELARLATGHTPSRRCPEYWAEGDIPWLALPDIRAMDCRVASETSEKTNAQGIANSSARVLPAGTVALSRTASVGFVTIFGRDMATSQDFVNWVCGPDLHAPFLMWLLRASRTFIKGASTGAVHQTVYMDVVERFRVCLPNLETQTAIATRLNEAFLLIQQLQSAHEAQLEALDALPGAYLREAFGNLEE